MGFLSRLLGLDTQPRELLSDLAQAYRAESSQAALLRAQAERARYPQAAASLRRLAEMEERHAGWLRERLVGLGGIVPNVASPLVSGNNPWERAVAAMQAAQGKRRRLIETITHWDPEEPAVVELLQRIEGEDSSEQPTYDDLIMRSDPQALD